MADTLFSSSEPAAGATPLPSPAEQLVQANHRLSVVNQELDVANEQLRVANEQLLVANNQLRVYNEEIRTQAADLQRAEEAVSQLNTELTLTNAGLLDTIADSLQATEFARAEAEAQRLRLHRLVAEVPAMIAVLTGPEHVVELANDHFRAMFGHRELVGQPFCQAVPELAGQPFFDQLDDVYRTGETYTGTDVPVTLDRRHSGQLEHLFATYIFQATRDGAGRIEGLLIFAYEVTEQVRARLEREAGARQRQLVTDALPVLIAYVDQAQRYQFNNQAYEEWFHQSPRALRGQYVREVVGEAAYAAAASYIARALAGERVDFEACMPYRDDLVKHIRTTYVPDVQQERVVGFYCLINDITEQVQARAEIERQQQQLHDLFMHAPGPIVILEGAAFHFTLVNPAYQQLFPGRDLLGKPLLDALPELADTPIPRLCRQVFETGEPYVAEELPLQLARREGNPLEEIYCTFTYQARRDAHGAIDGVVVFAYDVTGSVRARREVEAGRAQVQALNQHLVRTNGDLDAFVYTASHDLQGPINNLAGLLHALDQEFPISARSVLAAQILSLMHGSIERFRHTLLELSTTARLQAEAGQVSPAVSLASMVRDVLLDLALPIAKTNAEFIINVDECPPITLSEKNLRSVVYNLLSNAIKYGHPDRPPFVQVRCYHEQGSLVVSVQDNGLGLSEEQQKQLFQVFQRMHTHVEGTGMGLYLVKKILDTIGGSIRVESTVGCGSTFRAVFPI
ncbi:PAS domain-containing protein [Hymenobacter tibetensis]|uniref:histidine kinase n=1 Tax=Hymenobacter tibetensis TaxID=497967 RepID=A0ABY4CST9_9BACT|nr:PAS domain-containing sensor histidine kinase [Hymenobacter tibetensis]UOG73326.1 PAS domain-containing protein [Hymenobacter tibetensis]